MVVVEAFHGKMSEKDIGPREATFASMKAISGAIVAITLLMSAVFVPVAFMSGLVKVFYRQFSLTLAISIVISGINTLTLRPALCALILKDTHGENKEKNWLDKFFAGFNRGYDAVSNRYKGLIGVIASRRAGKNQGNLRCKYRMFPDSRLSRLW